MNLLLLRSSDLRGANYARVEGARAVELAQAHRLALGLRVRAGVLDGLLGHATVRSLSADAVELELDLSQSPPARLPCVLVVGLSRPQTIKKVLQAAVTLGVEELHFVRSERGEKSYSSATILTRELLSQELALGLAQAVDTVPPKVEVHQRFRPFVEDRLPVSLHETAGGIPVKLLADTSADGGAPRELTTSSAASRYVIAVGPEAGWSSYEVDKFKEHQFTSISLGPRMLRVETAVAVLLGWVVAVRQRGN
ncbi:MAG: 16S rRNA (uracil(1498)-N(3))-methyltransferase [Proteobacteria bacterium]|nr:16S rRNA (uracil(1498)-N(3))-methyltransferase [Pseudomonadota bacterium]